MSTVDRFKGHHTPLGAGQSVATRSLSGLLFMWLKKINKSRTLPDCSRWLRPRPAVREDGNDVLIAGTGDPPSTPDRQPISSSFPQHGSDPGALRPMASAAAVTNAYTLRSLYRVLASPRAAPATTVREPIILGAADLETARIEPLLKEAYHCGQAFALTNATAADARGCVVIGHPKRGGRTQGR